MQSSIVRAHSISAVLPDVPDSDIPRIRVPDIAMSSINVFPPTTGIEKDRKGTGQPNNY